MSRLVHPVRDNNRVKERMVVGDEGYSIHILEKPEKVKRTRNGLYYLGYIGQIGFVIAIPIAGGIILGSYLDTKWNMYPKMTLSLLMFGIFVSIVNFYHTIQEIIKDQ